MPDVQRPPALQYVPSPDPLKLATHAPTHPNTPFSAPPSPCSSSLFLGANSAPTPPRLCDK